MIKRFTGTQISKTISLTIIMTAGVSVFGAATAALGEAVIETRSTKITTTHAKQISSSGMDIVREIRLSREAIANKKLRAAKHHSWVALRKAAQLKAESPTEDLRERIGVAAKALRKSGKLDRKADLVPIYQQLDEVQYEHEDDIRAYLAKAEKGSKSGGVEKVENLLISAEADIGYMEVDLGLQQVVNDLRRAHSALSKPARQAKPQTADAQLEDALKHVHVVMGQASVALSEDDLSDS